MFEYLKALGRVGPSNFTYNSAKKSLAKHVQEAIVTFQCSKEEIDQV